MSDQISVDWKVFAAEHVAPFAVEIDRESQIPADVIDALRQVGAFASGFPEAYGGLSASDPCEAVAAHGEMHRALGYASASVQGLVNVHHMGGSALAKWGNKDQKTTWLPRLTSGEMLCAIAITEPNVGSDIASVETFAQLENNDFIVNGKKTWITCGQSADLFILIAGSENGPVALIVPSDAPGLKVHPIPDMLGCRGYMMAELILTDVYVPQECVLGSSGFGASHIAPTGLMSGRLNLAWGCVGLAQAAYDAALTQAKTREQFGQPIAEFQLVQQLITKMTTDIHAARLICIAAGEAHATRAMDAHKQVTMAKYFASTMVNRVTRDAQQIFGARGIGSDTPMAMYFRDARIMEVIEGTTQVLESMIARFSLAEFQG